MRSQSRVSMQSAVLRRTIASLRPVRSGLLPRTGTGDDRAAERLRRESATGAIALEKPLREKSNLLNGFNLIWVVQLSPQTYTSSLSPQISGYFRAVPSRQEGRIAIVTNARRDAVDAAASARKVDAGRGKLVSVRVAHDVPTLRSAPSP